MSASKRLGGGKGEQEEEAAGHTMGTLMIQAARESCRAWKHQGRRETQCHWVGSSLSSGGKAEAREGWAVCSVPKRWSLKDGSRDQGWDGDKSRRQDEAGTEDVGEPGTGRSGDRVVCG